nr:phospholipase D family protein [Ideonella oryzae]
MAHLSAHFANFLQRGGQLSVVVGIDIQNTTMEGLRALLDLGAYGRIETFVYHNEASGVFHPKLYLFRNEEEARLIVGSNNLTRSGLYVNVEAGLQVDVPVDAPVIGQALHALESWKDTESRLAIRLDGELLERLVLDGYVVEEARAQADRPRGNGAGRGLQGRQPLFGSRRVLPPPVPGAHRGEAAAGREGGPAGAGGAAMPPVAPAGTVLLMRLRKANQSTRPTQTQIPLRVAHTFFDGVAEVQSAHTGERHGIRFAHARGGLNTLKLEIPEMANFAQPVARFERTPDGVVYQVYDNTSAPGLQIMHSLNEGRRDNSTQMSIADAERATWWRSI